MPSQLLAAAPALAALQRFRVKQLSKCFDPICLNWWWDPSCAHAGASLPPSIPKQRHLTSFGKAKHEAWSAQSKQEGLERNERCLGLSLASSLQEELKRGSFRALLSRCSAFLLSNNASFLLSSSAASHFPLLPSPLGSVPVPLGMPGQALTDFLRSICKRGVRVSNTHLDFSGKKPWQHPENPFTT